LSGLETLPVVGVLSTRATEGATALDTPGLEIVLPTPLGDALARPWTTDAHFVTYALSVGADWAETWPRCNKPSLPRIRERGGNLWSTCLVLDWDFPRTAAGTREWTAGQWKAFRESLRLGVKTPLDDWAWLYSTRHGARLVYVLSTPVLVEQGEALVREVLDRWEQLGIVFDRACKDWTRLFRLPYVMRRFDDGSEAPTWEDPTSEAVPRPERRLDPETLAVGPPRLAPSTGEAPAVSDDLPTIDRCRQLLQQVGDSGKRSPTPWARMAKKALEGRDCFASCFEHAPLAAPGSRDATIQRLIGEACAVLRRVVGSSPSLVFALFSEALEQLDADKLDVRENWRQVGWRAVCRYWQRESEKLAGEAQQVEQQKAQARSLEDHVLEGLLQWCDAPELRAGSDAARWWLSTHLICATERHLHVMQPNGYYDPIASTKTLLSARIRELGMDSLIPLWEARSNGEGQKPIDPQRLIDRFATRVGRTEGAIGARGVTIRDIGQAGATMIYRMFARRDLEPTYDAEVDLWLQYLMACDASDYSALCRWIGYALDFEGGPICALSLSGAPGSGKKMLVQGLAECIDTETTASASDFGRFQEILLRTPFLVVNEGLARQGYGVQHVADQFRRYVSGDPILVEPKFMDKIQIRSPLRVMFVANNMDVIQELTGNRDLSPEDRRALAVRILHLSTSERAASWLRMRGGLQFTRGWIRADAGGPSQFRVARHFLWLYQQRPPVPAGNRFLVEGNVDDEMIAQMSTRSGSAPSVIETLIAMIERASQLPALASSIRIEGTRIYVTTSGVCEAWRMFFSERRGGIDELNVRRVSTVLRGLSAKDEEPPRSTNGPRVRWREIDPELLLREALEHGYPCTRLANLAAGRRTLTETARTMEKVVK